MRLILFTLLTTATLLSQAQSDFTIQYTSTRKLQISIEGDMPPPPGLPDKITTNTVLYTNGHASLYRNAEQQNDAMNVEREAEDGGQVIIKMAPPENIIYCDLDAKTMTQQREFMQRDFLIESPAKNSNWKLTGKQKMILSYPCQQAMQVDSMDTVMVWFTPVIPVSSGPMTFIGLPGMVLEVELDHGMEVITATAVQTTVDADMIKKPKDGKKVTQEEYDKIVEEKLKEMGVQPGPGGRAVIRIENH